MPIKHTIQIVCDAPKCGKEPKSFIAVVDLQPAETITDAETWLQFAAYCEAEETPTKKVFCIDCLSNLDKKDISAWLAQIAARWREFNSLPSE